MEGQSIVIENRYARSDEELPNLVAELVHLKVDVIFAAGSPRARVARDSVQTIPVVFVTFADPVRSGLVKYLLLLIGTPSGPTTEKAKPDN